MPRGATQAVQPRGWRTRRRCRPSHRGPSQMRLTCCAALVRAHPPTQSARCGDPRLRRYPRPRRARRPAAEEWLRNILVDAGALPHRDVYLRQTEKFVEARLLTIQNRDDRVAARTFMEWHHLRKLRD